MRHFILFLALILVASCGQKEEPANRSESGDTPDPASADVELTWTPPEGWVEEPPSSGMRLSQYALPKAEGDDEDASCYVFHFPGAGGSVEANIERWYSQFTQPDDRPTASVAKVNKREVHGFQQTIVDVTGTFNPSQMGMGMAASADTEPGYRMLGGVVETPAGPWFAKLVGPEKTVEKWEESFYEFMDSFRPKS